MADIAALGLRVDGIQQIERTRQALAALIKTGDEAEKALDDFGNESKSTANDLNTLANAVRTAGQALSTYITVSTVKNISQELYNASAAAERLRISLDFSSARGSASEIAYLRAKTRELGLEFESTAKAYQSFNAAARGTAIEGDKARAIFESIAKASAVMGLSADNTSGVLLALQQMISKGTVQAEELRGQLGERLPGAFQIAARAMGVTTAELGKMLENGEVISDDFLPKFARQMEEELGDSAEKAAQRLDASTNRMVSAWERLKQNVGDSGVSSFIAGQLQILTDGMDNFNNSIEAARNAGDGFGGQMLAAAGAALEFLNPINAISYSALDAANQLEQAEKRLAELREAGAKTSSNLMLREAYAHAERLVNKLREAKAAKDALAGESAPAEGGDPYNSGSQYGAYLEREKKRAEAQVFLLQKSAEANAITKRFTEDLQGYAKALESGAITEQQYAAAITEANQKRYESTAAGKAAKKAADEAASSAKDGANAYQNLSEKISEYVNRLQIEAQQGSRLSQSQKLQIELDGLLAKSKGKVSAATVASMQASIAIARALEREANASKQAQDAYQDYLETQKALANYQVQLSKNQESLGLALDKTTREIQEQSELLDLEERMIGKSNEERQLAIELLQIERDLRKEIDEIDRMDLPGGEASREEARVRARTNAAKKIANAERKVYIDSWKNINQYIEDGLYDAIVTGGASAKEAITRMFQNMVLRPVVQAAVGSLFGSAGGSASGQSGGYGSILSTVSNLKSAYSLVTGGLVSSIANGVGAIGTAIGSSAATSFAAGMKGASLASGLAGPTTAGATGAMGWGASAANAIPVVGWIAAGMGASASAYSQGYTEKDLNWANPIGLVEKSATRILTAVGVSDKLAHILTGASLTAKIFDKLGLGGETPHRGAAAEYLSGEIISSGKEFTKRAANNAKFSSDVQGSINALSGMVGGTLDAVAQMFGKISGYRVAAGFTSDGKDKSHGLFRVTDTSGDQLVQWLAKRSGEFGSRATGYAYNKDAAKGYDEYLKSVTAATIPLLKDIAPDWADALLTGAVSQLGYSGDAKDWKSIQTTGAESLDVLQGVVQQIALTKAAFQELGETMEMFSGVSVEVESALLNAFGGIEGVAQVAGQFYQSYYSEQERYEASLKQMRDVLASLNVSIDPAMGDKAKAELRAGIESVMQAGNAEFAAQLLALAPAFAGLADYAEKLNPVITELGTALSDVMVDLLSERKSLEAELLRAQGDQSGYLDAIRAIATEGYADAERAAWDYNTALQSQIEALDAAADAAQVAAQVAASLRSEVIGIEGRFAGGGFSRLYKAQDVAVELAPLVAKVGWQTTIDEIINGILTQTSEKAEQITRAIWEGLDSDEARLQLVRLSNVMLDLAKATDDAKANLEQLTAQRFSSLQSAASLLGRIDQAMGGTGTAYSARVESHLWNQLASTNDLQRQIELSGQLTEMVLQRHNAEAAAQDAATRAAEQQLAWAKSLGSYVQSLTTGSLSPLTTEQKLTEASSYYQQMLTGARTGDATAQENLQGAASSYLEIARTFFASSDQYSSIFSSVTGALQQLGVTTQGTAQQRMADAEYQLSSQSLSQLQQLYAITEQAYATAERDYMSGSALLGINQQGFAGMQTALDALPEQFTQRTQEVVMPQFFDVFRSGNDALVAEIKALRAEVAQLRAENHQDATALAHVAAHTSASNAERVVQGVGDAVGRAAHQSAITIGATYA